MTRQDSHNAHSSGFLPRRVGTMGLLEQIGACPSCAASRCGEMTPELVPAPQEARYVA